MASITKEILSPWDAARVWDVIRDIGALHTRLVPGFVTDTSLIAGGRRVTFVNGLVIEEPIVSCSDPLQRLVWTSRGEHLATTHYNAAVQVHPRAAGGCRIEWTADFLPDSMAAVINGMMEDGARAMARALSGSMGLQ